MRDTSNYTKYLLLLISLIGWWMIAYSVAAENGGGKFSPLPTKTLYHHRMRNAQKRRDPASNSTISPPLSPSLSPTWIRDAGVWLPVKQQNYPSNFDPNSNNPTNNGLIPYPSYYAKQHDQLPSYSDSVILSPSHSTPTTPTITWSHPHSYYPTSTQHRREPQYQHQHDYVPAKKKVCSGKKNLVDDFGIISLILSAFSTFVGFSLDLVLSFKGNTVAIISKFFGLLFSVPSSAITALNVSNPFTYLLSNGLNILSIATTLFGTGGGVSIGNLGLATDVIFEILGIYGLVLSVFSTFPDLFDEVVDAAYVWGYGPPVKAFIEGYGCHNPYYNTANTILK